MTHPVATFTQVVTPERRTTVLKDDMHLYGWTVVWEFACYVTDLMIDAEFGTDKRRPACNASHPLPLPHIFSVQE